jgi:PhnB protein
MDAPTPYLNFANTCEEAFNFYKKVFGGEFDYIGRFKDMPPDMKCPPGFEDKIMHVSLRVGGKPFLLGSDTPEGYGDALKQGTNVSLAINPDNEAEARRLYDALREGGNVTMELTPTFWAKLFAMIRDKHGIHWMISYGEPAGN